MKKINILWMCVLVVLFMAGCDKDADLIDNSYLKLNTSFNPQELGANYRITFKGSESPYVHRDDPTGVLEVFPVTGNTTTAVLKEENYTVTNDEVVFVTPVGAELAIYSEDKYVAFTPNVIFSAAPDLYSLRLENDEMKVGEQNFVPKISLPGTLNIVNKETGDELFAQELNTTSDNKMNIMQLSDTEFSEIPETEDADPESGFCKVRFLYTADAFPNNPELKLVVYLADNLYINFSEPIANITLTAGVLSEYILIDNNYFGEGSVGGIYDLIDPNDESHYIVDNTRDFSTSIGFDRCPDYKFMTFRFTDPNHIEGDGVHCNDILSTPWE